MIDFDVCRHLIVLVVELYEAALFLLQFVEINLLLVALCGTVLIRLAILRVINDWLSSTFGLVLRLLPILLLILLLLLSAI